MPVTISDEALSAAHISGPELKQELALALFQQERLTPAQASRLAEITKPRFRLSWRNAEFPSAPE